MKFSPGLTTLFIFSFFGLAACGGAVSDGDSWGETSAPVQAVADEAQTLPLESGSSELNFDSLDDDAQVTLVLYGLDETQSQSAFTISAADDSSSAFLQYDSSSDEDEVSDDWDLTEEFHDTLRLAEEELKSENELPVSTVSYAQKYLSVGDERAFKVLSSTTDTSQYTTIQAELRYSGENFNMYVDTRNKDSLDDEDLSEIADSFNVDGMRILFGEESDVDHDGKFNIIFSQAINQLGQSQGGRVTGFFYAADLFDASVYPVSNEMEGFFVAIPDNDGEYGSVLNKSFALSNLYTTVLHHEFQHMINFNQHFFINGGSSEASWLNEGMSLLAEDISTLDETNYMPGIGIENPSHIASYLRDTSAVCFMCGSSLSQRSGAYLFLRYIYEQAQLGNISTLVDGAEPLSGLLDSDLTGKDNLLHAIFGDANADDQLGALFGQYALALVLSENEDADSTLKFQSMSLYQSFDDNRHTNLNGPAISTVSQLPYTDTLTGNAIAYVRLSGKQINQAGGSLHVDVSEGVLMDGYVIVQ